MKKIIAVFILVVLGIAMFTSISHAQTTTTYAQQTTTTYTVDTVEAKTPQDWRTRFYVGIKGGYNYSNVYDSEGDNFEADSKFGFVAGIFLSIPLGEFVSIQPELLFSQRGFHATGTLFDSEYELTRTSNYIDVPLLVAIKAGKGITFVAGPQFSYLMVQTDKFTGSTINEEQEQEFKTDNIRKNMLCFLGGIDFNFNHFVLGTRVGWDVRRNKGDGTSTTPRYKNAWVQATLGYRF